MYATQAQKYLSREGVPEWLKFQIETPKYGYFDITADRKYYDYFSNLNSDGLMFQRSNLNSTSDYYHRHRVMKPDMVHRQQSGDQSHADTEQNFLNYFHCPVLFSDKVVSSRMFQTTCTIGDKVYSTGGMTVMSMEEQYELLGDLTDEFDLDPSLLELRFDYDLPQPLNADFIKSPFVKPLDEVQVFHSQSSTLQHFPFDDESPPPLICASACVLSQHHILLYGGFELITEVFREGEKLVIEKRIVVNDTPYILDTTKMRFQEMKLQVHPTVSAKFPNSVPRFGHQMVAVPVEEMNKEKILPSAATLSELTTSSNSMSSPSMRSSGKMSSPAVAFVMGGYKMDKNGKFVPINDIWKAEVFISQAANQIYFNFSEEIVAYPLGRYDVEHDDTGKFSGIIKTSGWPAPRGFFSLVVMGGGHNSFSHSAGSTTPDSQSMMGATVTKKLMLYGGSTIRKGQTEILGDIWWFDVSSETWTPIDAFSNFDNTGAQLSQLKRCGHVGLLADDYFIVSGGVGPNEIGLDYKREEEVFDIGDRLNKDRIKLYATKQREYISLAFNTETQMWKYAEFVSDLLMTDTLSKILGMKDIVFNSVGASGGIYNGRMFFMGGFLHVYSTADGKQQPIPLTTLVELNMPMLTI